MTIIKSTSGYRLWHGDTVRPAGGQTFYESAFQAIDDIPGPAGRRVEVKSYIQIPPYSDGQTITTACGVIVTFNLPDDPIAERLAAYAKIRELAQQRVTPRAVPDANAPRKIIKITQAP